MKILQTRLSILAAILIIFACSKDDDPQIIKSSEKSISSFKFSSLTPEVVGTISTDFKVSATVPRGTDVTALSPTIVISENATISPASGAAQNFTNPVTYTVTAEDGTTQQYVVTVSVEKNSEKSISTFKFAGLNPQVEGTITESEHKITLVVPYGTSVSALTPTIELSQGATVNPASGAAQNFTNPVTYTVTAENGSTQQYEVTVLVDFILAEFTGDFQVERNEYFEFWGYGFGNDYSKNKVQFINIATNVVTDLPAMPNSSDLGNMIFIPVDFPLGVYRARVFVGTLSKLIETATFEVIIPFPKVTSGNATVKSGETLTLTGKNFASSGNTVKLVSMDYMDEYQVEITAESETSITIQIPWSIPHQEYMVVIDNGTKSKFQEPTVTVNPSTVPHIVSTNKFSYNRGETIIITGHNLKKVGAITNINFIPFTSGVTQVRSGVANSAGTQVTFVIPNDFTTGTYVLVIEVDGKLSEEYDEVIQINP